MRDDEFEPKLGKIANRISTRERTYLQRVLHASVLAGTKGVRSTFTGQRIGRGTGAGRVLSTRGRSSALRTRRVILKARIVKLAGKGVAAARAHLRYIQRDGVPREGLPGQLYDAERVDVNGKAFLEQGEGDRHQFRFIVSAEDGAEYEDLKPFVRGLMAQMEKDLGTKLDWVAVDHFNTGHPHTHIVVRGKNDLGEDLIIGREYITHGMRERAAEIVSLDLGPRTDLEIATRLRSEVEQDRFTSLDRGLLRDADDDRVVAAGRRGLDAFQQTLRAGRLQKLRRLGLSEELKPGSWRLGPELEPTLRRMGERGDIIKAMHREMSRQGRERRADYAIYDPVEGQASRLVGRVEARGLADELHDRYYLVLDGLDGRTHHIDIGNADGDSLPRNGSVIAITARRAEPRTVDRAIAEIAAAHGGHYSVDIHLAHDPHATADFAETHVRRLEAMRRITEDVEREKDGTWIIAANHLKKAAEFERALVRQAPVRIDTLSLLPVERQIGADGATWLDRELTSRAPESVRDAGFGRAVNDALTRRRQWLVEQELAKEEDGRTIYRTNLLNVLRRRELNRVARQLSDKLGLAYAETKSGDHVEGVYRRPVELASGKFALIEKARDFTLVPWRPVLERSLGQRVTGIARDQSISWTLGRQRSGPEIS
jgi:type IV secretory pathway VirD2 relaxase